MRLESRQYRYLEALGIEVYREREPQDRGRSQRGAGVKPVPGHTPDTGAVGGSHDAEAEGIAADPAGKVVLDWEALQREVAGCRLCPLHEGRTQTVFGVGDVNADWMLIGEAPGAEEDRRGEPFVGRAG